MITFSGYKNLADEALVELYEMDGFDSLVDQLFSEIRPLYIELHTYVRHKLSSFYGSNKVSNDGLIPAHVLGMYLLHFLYVYVHVTWVTVVIIFTFFFTFARYLYFS